jgi:Ala-tRNA(Pro) deacylase
MPETRDELFERLAALGIETGTVEHPPLFTVEESRALRGEIPGGHCKNLFLKDRKGALWLVVTLEDAAVDLKALPARIGAGRLSFGRAELLMEVLGVTPGSVTPFALINDIGRRVNVVLDAAMMAEEVLNYHPLTNEATTSIAAADLIRFLRDTGHDPAILAVAD